MLSKTINIFTHENYLLYDIIICNVLRLARGNTKKRSNKKSGESISPIRSNVTHMYICENVSV